MVVNAPRDQETLLLALAAFPDDLGRALTGQPTEALVRPASDGGWGVVENLCHLRDWEAIFLERAVSILSEVRPLLAAYDDELWAIERDYRGEQPLAAFETFRAARVALVDQLDGIASEAWFRVGVHSVRGEITLRWLAELARDHAEEHLAEIRDALG